MTRPLKTSSKTASRALFLRAGRLLTPKNRIKPLKIPPAVTYRGFFCQKNFTGKEPDPETGLYYYGSRYLDPKTSRWISGDPALGEYLPVAPLGDEEKKRNRSLPGQGGVFNYVNLHVYHYVGNNPVKYVDPDGRYLGIKKQSERYFDKAPLVPNKDRLTMPSLLKALEDFDSKEISPGGIFDKNTKEIAERDLGKNPQEALDYVQEEKERYNEFKKFRTKAGIGAALDVLEHAEAAYIEAYNSPEAKEMNESERKQYADNKANERIKERINEYRQQAGDL